jgi:hypothetical protein
VHNCCSAAILLQQIVTRYRWRLLPLSDPLIVDKRWGGSRPATFVLARRRQQRLTVQRPAVSTPTPAAGRPLRLLDQRHSGDRVSGLSDGRRCDRYTLTSSTNLRTGHQAIFDYNRRRDTPLMSIHVPYKFRDVFPLLTERKKKRTQDGGDGEILSARRM